MSVFATLSLEGGPIFWVSTHRVHHQLSDKEGDPHTPREGGWWAHAGWILFGESLHAQIQALCALFARPEPRPLPRLAQQVSLDSHHDERRPAVLARLVLGRLGERLGMFLWGAFLRVTLGLHATWLVNSATHCGATAALNPRRFAQ